MLTARIRELEGVVRELINPAHDHDTRDALTDVLICLEKGAVLP